jgi:hypothetical protein
MVVIPVGCIKKNKVTSGNIIRFTKSKNKERAEE